VRSLGVKFALLTALNYADCFAYALAKAMDAPLLCKGNDFPLTDIGIA
jgi:ribonuclease VapC